MRQEESIDRSIGGRRARDGKEGDTKKEKERGKEKEREERKRGIPMNLLRSRMELFFFEASVFAALSPIACIAQFQRRKGKKKNPQVNFTLHPCPTTRRKKDGSTAKEKPMTIGVLPAISLTTLSTPSEPLSIISKFRLSN